MAFMRVCKSVKILNYALFQHRFSPPRNVRKRSTFANILALDAVRLVLGRNCNMPGGHSGLRLQTKALHTAVKEHERELTCGSAIQHTILIHLKTPGSFGQWFISATSRDAFILSVNNMSLNAKSQTVRIMNYHFSTSDTGNQISWSYWSSCVSRAQRLRVSALHTNVILLIVSELLSFLSLSEAKLLSQPRCRAMTTWTSPSNLSQWLTRAAQSQATLRLRRAIIPFHSSYRMSTHLSFYLNVFYYYF